MNMSEAWQKGIDLEYLRSLSSVFAAVHKPLVFGAFGLVKERDIATHLDNKSCLTISNPPTAVALFTILKNDSHNRTFSGKDIVVHAGSVLVHDFAALDLESACQLLELVLDINIKHTKVTSRGFFRAQILTVIEIFEEDAIAKEALGEFGYEYVGTKITAGAEIKGLYCWSYRHTQSYEKREEFLTLHEINNKFVSSVSLAKIRRELLQTPSYWEQHYSYYNKRKSWTSFCLRGYDAQDPGFIIKPSEMSKKWKEENPERLKATPVDTEISGLFLETMSVVNSIPGKKDRVRFMRLRHEDGELTRHADITDRDAGVADGKVARLHIPIVTSPKVEFHSWNARGVEIVKNFAEGSLFYLDQRKPHAVVNTDPIIDRIHLVIDVFSSQPLRDLLLQ